MEAIIESLSGELWLMFWIFMIFKDTSGK